jgi:hypothetical protein
MSIAFACPNCQSNYEVKDSLAGRPARCRKCARQMTVPVVEEHAPPDEHDEHERDDEPERPRQRRSRSEPRLRQQTVPARYLPLLLALAAVVLMMVSAAVAGTAMYVVGRAKGRSEAVMTSDRQSPANLARSANAVEPAGRAAAKWTRQEFQTLLTGKNADQVIATVGRPDRTVELPAPTAPGGYMDIRDVRGAAQAAAANEATRPALVFYFDGATTNPFTGRPERAVVRFNSARQFLSVAWES